MIDCDEFKKILDLYISNDKINHAYLIETNSSNRIALAHTLIEKLLNNKDITVDDLARNGDLYVVSTENVIIKKEEIINLKDELSTKSIYSGKRFYIIEEAEKLNKSSANTLLKFLEEPDEDIIAILITSSKYKIIETILSRCQVIRYFNNENIENVELPEFFEKVIDFTIKLSKEKVETIAYINNYFDKDMFDRKVFNDIVSSMLYIYYDVIQYKVGLDLLYCNDYKDKIIELAENNSFEELNNKVLAVNNAIDKLSYYANTKLVLDSMIIDSYGGIENV